MFPSLSTLALPLLLLSAPFASASSSHGGVNSIKRSHSRRAALSPEQKRDAEIIGASRNATTAAQAQAHSLDKRQSFHGRGTYYYVDVGPGACGNWGNNADYTVALNSAQYCCGYPGPHCFQTITITANGVTVGGVRIMDECPTCGYGDLDLSPGLFERFAGFGAGVIQLDWHFDNGAPAPAPTTQAPPPAPTTSQWVEPSPAWTPPPAPSPSPSTPAWSPPPAPSPSTSSPPPPPPPSSTSVWVAPSSSSASSALVSSSVVSGNATASAANATVNPFAIVSSANSSASATSASVSAPSGSAAPTGQGAGAGVTHTVQVAGNNFEAINALVANYGQVVVVGAGARN